MAAGGGATATKKGSRGKGGNGQATPSRERTKRVREGTIHSLRTKLSIKPKMVKGNLRVKNINAHPRTRKLAAASAEIRGNGAAWLRQLSKGGNEPLTSS